MANIYDCCMFFNELDMLETRLRILDDVVEHFVVCEAAETHSGQPKPYYLAENRKRFAPWWDKIIYVQVDDLTGNGRNSWERERYQRAQLERGLRITQDDDWIIVGDCDEIPNPECVQWLRDSQTTACAAKFELDFYYYDLNHRVKEGWAIGAARAKWKLNPNDIRTCANLNHTLVSNPSGWHFSYFGGAEQIVRKVNAFMHHADVAQAMPRDPAWVAGQVKQSADLFGRTIQIEHVPLPDTLPRYILANQDKYRQMGWIAD